MRPTHRPHQVKAARRQPPRSVRLVTDTALQVTGLLFWLGHRLFSQRSGPLPSPDHLNPRKGRTSLLTAGRSVWVRRFNVAASITVALLLFTGGQGIGGTLAYFVNTQTIDNKTISAAEQFAPTALGATILSATSVGLSWTAPTNSVSWLTGYKVFRKTAGTTTSALITAGGCASTTTSVSTATSCTDNDGLVSGRTYYYTVRAVSGNGGSAVDSNQIAVIAGSTVAPTVVSQFPANAAGAAAVTTGIHVRFSNSMDRTTTEAAFCFRETSGACGVIVGTTSWGAINTGGTAVADTALSFKPTSALTANTSYTVEIATTASNTAGTQLGVLYSSAFTTADGTTTEAGTLDIASPVNGAFYSTTVTPSGTATGLTAPGTFDLLTGAAPDACSTSLVTGGADTGAGPAALSAADDLGAPTVGAKFLCLRANGNTAFQTMIMVSRDSDTPTAVTVLQPTGARKAYTRDTQALEVDFAYTEDNPASYIVRVCSTGTPFASCTVNGTNRWGETTVSSGLTGGTSVHVTDTVTITPTPPNGTYDLRVQLTDAAGTSTDGVAVGSVEVYAAASLTLTSDDVLLSPGQTAQITATLLDPVSALNPGQSVTFAAVTDPASCGTPPTFSPNPVTTDTGTGAAVTTLTACGNTFNTIIVTASVSDGTATTLTKNVVIYDPPPDPPEDLVLTVGSIRMAWKPSPSKDTAGYRVSIGTRSKKYDHDVDVGNVTSYRFTDVAPGTTYFVAVRSYDGKGRLGAPTREQSLTVPMLTPTPSPTPNPCASPAATTTASPVASPAASVTAIMTATAASSPATGSTRTAQQAVRDLDDATPTASPTATPTATATATVTVSPTAAVTGTVPCASATPSPTATVTVTATATATLAPAATPAGSVAGTPVPSATPTPTATTTVTATATATGSATPTPGDSPSSGAAGSAPPDTGSTSGRGTSTPRPEPSPTGTATASPVATPSPSPTPAPSPSAAPTTAPTGTATAGSGSGTGTGAASDSPAAGSGGATTGGSTGGAAGATGGSTSPSNTGSGSTSPAAGSEGSATGGASGAAAGSSGAGGATSGGTTAGSSGSTGTAGSATSGGTTAGGATSGSNGATGTTGGATTGGAGSGSSATGSTSGGSAPAGGAAGAASGGSTGSTAGSTSGAGTAAGSSSGGGTTSGSTTSTGSSTSSGSTSGGSAATGSSSSSSAPSGSSSSAPAGGSGSGGTASSGGSTGGTSAAGQ